jgi:hypothetical protein
MGTAEELEADLAGRAVAPRVTLEELRSRIVQVEYYNPKGTAFTLCLIHLDNGFVVTGESAPVCPANYDREVGTRLAYERAEGEVWKLLGFLLRERLYREAQGAADRDAFVDGLPGVLPAGDRA